MLGPCGDGHLWMATCDACDGHLWMATCGACDGHLWMATCGACDGHLWMATCGACDGHLWMVTCGACDGHLWMATCGACDGHLWMATCGACDGVLCHFLPSLFCYPPSPPPASIEPHLTTFVRLLRAYLTQSKSKIPRGEVNDTPSSSHPFLSSPSLITPHHMACHWLADGSILYDIVSYLEQHPECLTPKDPQDSELSALSYRECDCMNTNSSHTQSTSFQAP